jgi:hypothetical protein
MLNAVNNRNRDKDRICYIITHITHGNLTHISRTLREVLDPVLNNVGPVFKQLIYEELEKAGVHLDSPYSTLTTVEKVFSQTFGPDATSLLINTIRKTMNEN